MLGIVTQQPVRLRRDCRKKYWNIGFMTDHFPCVPHGSRIRVRNDFRACQVDESAIVLEEFVCLGCGQSLRMEEKVLFDFIADRFSQDETGDLRGAQRQNGFVESPFGNYSAESARSSPEINGA